MVTTYVILGAIFLLVLIVILAKMQCRNLENQRENDILKVKVKSLETRFAEFDVGPATPLSRLNRISERLETVEINLTRVMVSLIAEGLIEDFSESPDDGDTGDPLDPDDPGGMTFDDYDKWVESKQEDTVGP